MIFALKALLAGLIIAFSSWLAGQNPRMAGYIIALPIASLIAIAFVYFEHSSVEKTILYAKSILVAIPVSYLFFLPFFLAKQFNMNFWLIYGSGVILLTLGFFIHKYFVNFLSWVLKHSIGAVNTLGTEVLKIHFGAYLDVR